MTSILDGALAKTVGKALGGVFYVATLTRLTPGVGPAWDPGAPTETAHACKGLVDTYSAYERQNTLIQAGDVKVLLLATSLAITPTAGDKVTIRGVAYNIIDVSTDPAKAVWVLQARA